MKNNFKTILVLTLCIMLCLVLSCSEEGAPYTGDADDIISVIGKLDIGGTVTPYYERIISVDGKTYFSSKDGYTPSTEKDGEKVDGLIDLNEYLDFKYVYYRPSFDAGQLTASLVNDNDKYSYFTSLCSKGQEEDGEFKKYADGFAFNTLHRIKVSVPGVKGANVYLSDNSFKTTTDANGYAYLFTDDAENHEVCVSYVNEDNEVVELKQNSVFNEDLKFTVTDAKESQDMIELMFVIDTTGSMGDEIDFLKSEIDNVISEVKKSNPNVTIYLALLFYRDKGDTYVTRYSDFTLDIDSQKEFLSKQSANGGGDFEEAVYKAFNEAVNKNWTTNNSTKLIVHVADAPSHDNEVSAWNNEVLKCAEKGIKIINVASSGIDKKTEYFFRAECLITGGSYVYLTNDSGIGGDHIEATTEEKPVVEYLNALLIRLINGYHNGDFGEAVAYNGNLKESELPTEMPEDFKFEIYFGQSLINSFISETGVLTVKENTKTIVLEEEDMADVYKAMRLINIFDISEVSSFEEFKDTFGIVLKVSYGETSYQCGIKLENDYLTDKTEYYFYKICETVYSYLVDQIYTEEINTK